MKETERASINIEWLHEKSELCKMFYIEIEYIIKHIVLSSQVQKLNFKTDFEISAHTSCKFSWLHGSAFVHLYSTKENGKYPSFSFKLLTQLLLGIWQTTKNRQFSPWQVLFFCFPQKHSSSLNSKYVFSDDNRLNMSLDNLRKYPTTPGLSLSLVHIKQHCPSLSKEQRSLWDLEEQSP